MRQLPNGDVEIYANLGKSMLFVITIITIPIYAFLLFAALVWHSVDIYFFLVTAAMLTFIFGISYLFVRKTDIPPFLIIHEDSLEYQTKYNVHFLPLQQFIGFTTTQHYGQVLILITKKFRKKYTTCLLCMLDEKEKTALFDVLQARGLTYFPPGSELPKK